MFGKYFRLTTPVAWIVLSALRLNTSWGHFGHVFTCRQIIKHGLLCLRRINIHLPCVNCRNNEPFCTLLYKKKPHKEDFVVPYEVP